MILRQIQLLIASVFTCSAFLCPLSTSLLRCRPSSVSIFMTNKRERDTEERIVEEVKAVVEKAQHAVEDAVEDVTKKAVDAEVAARDRLVKLAEKGLEVATGNIGAYQQTGADYETDKLTITTYFFGKDKELWEDIQRVGVQPRRFFLYTSLAGALALGGNFLGMTSGLLGLNPDWGRGLHLDAIYPIKGYKRCIDTDFGFEFMYPMEWLGDQAIPVAAQIDRLKLLEQPSNNLSMSPRRQAQRNSLRPIAAFGPPGGNKLENASVIRSILEPNFSLKGTLGPPEEAAERLLSTSIAPEGSGRVWELINARSRGEGKEEVYEFEYTIKTERIYIHSLCVIAARGNELFTLTVVSPQDTWSERGGVLKPIAESFTLRSE